MSTTLSTPQALQYLTILEQRGLLEQARRLNEFVMTTWRSSSNGGPPQEIPIEKDFADELQTLIAS